MHNIKFCFNYLGTGRQERNVCLQVLQTLHQAVPSIQCASMRLSTLVPVSQDRMLQPQVSQEITSLRHYLEVGYFFSLFLDKRVKNDYSGIESQPHWLISSDKHGELEKKGKPLHGPFSAALQLRSWNGCHISCLWLWGVFSLLDSVYPDSSTSRYH